MCWSIQRCRAATSSWGFLVPVPVGRPPGLNGVGAAVGEAAYPVGEIPSRSVQSVVYVSGHVVNTMTGAFRGEGKTDAKDARVIAETARMRSDLSEVAMPDELVVELAQLTGYRTDVMADWVRGVNRLRSLLGSIFPGLEAAFDYSNRTPLILVAHLCTPAEIRAAGIKGVTAYLGDNGGWPTAIAKT